MWACTNCTLVFTCPFGPSRNVGRVDQAPELFQVAGPPLVQPSYSGVIDGGQGFPLLTPSTPVAIKRIHAVGYIHSCIQKCGSSQPVFGLKIDDRAHTNDRVRS